MVFHLILHIRIHGGQIRRADAERGISRLPMEKVSILIHPFRRSFFHIANKICQSDLRRKGNEYVHVILTSRNGANIDPILARNIGDQEPELLLNRRLDDLASAFRSEGDVDVIARISVGHSTIFRHKQVYWAVRKPNCGTIALPFWECLQFKLPLPSWAYVLA
jgi:hypothetical protein